MKHIVPKWIRKKLQCRANKIYGEKIVKEIEKDFPDNVVLIFQAQFLDLKGEVCFNGGAERYVRDLSDILIHQKYTPILIQMADSFWKKEIGSMTVIGLPAINIYAYKQILHYFTKYQFVIYSGSILWGKTLLHPNILVSHGITWDCPHNDVNTSKIFNIFNDVDQFVSVDTNTISWLRSTFSKSMNGKQMIYIPNYVDTSSYRPVKHSSDRVKVAFPRRAAPERGYWFISRVIPFIMDKYPFVDFDFIGFAHGEEIKSDLERLKSHYPERIRHFVVEPDQMVEVYQQTDISLIPTQYSEGTSLSCLEAQACGNVVIATNIGGLPNLILDGYNGILINPNEDELLKALDRVVSNEKLRQFLSQNAVSVASVFDKKIWISRWEEVIKKIKN